MNSSVPTYFRRAVTAEDLAPSPDPDVEVEQLEEGKPFIFSATVEVRPRLCSKVRPAKSHVTKPSVEVTDADVDEWIERLRERSPSSSRSGRPAQQDDFVTVDLTVTRAQVTVEQASARDCLCRWGPLEVGTSSTSRAVGSRPGAVAEDLRRTPERFGEDLGGARVQVTALVKDVKARSLPDVDDEFAKTASEFDTVDQLRDDLRERLTDMKEREARAEIATSRCKR